MKVLDIINEGWKDKIFAPIGKRIAAKVVIEEIAKGWAKEMKLYYQTYGKTPTLDELKRFVPAEKLTAEKAIAKSDEVQQAAYDQAVKMFKSEQLARTVEFAKKGVAIGLRKLGKTGIWISAFMKWGARAALVWNCKSAWDNYDNELQGALDDLGSGKMSGEEFKKFHDRILLIFWGEAVAAIGATILALGLPKVIANFSGIGSGPTRTFFGNLIKTATALGTSEYVVKWLASDEGAKLLALYLTSQGVVDDNGQIIEPPNEIGSFFEGWFSKTEHFKKKALEVAEKKGMGDKIPPSVRPKAATQPAPAGAAPAASTAPAATDSDEPEPPVSGRAEGRPQQGAQAQKPAGTVIDWSELSKEGK